MNRSPMKIRLTVEMDVDIDTEEYPDMTEEEVRRAVVIQDSDVIDGFEITTNHPDYDNTNDFFLSNAVIVKKELITAEQEHKKEVDETTDMITAEDIVEQAVYAANAPECCADEHAEIMLSMLGANIVDEEVYHDEDECPKLEMGGMK